MALADVEFEDVELADVELAGAALADAEFSNVEFSNGPPVVSALEDEAEVVVLADALEADVALEDALEANPADEAEEDTCPQEQAAKPMVNATAHTIKTSFFISTPFSFKALIRVPLFPR